MSTNRPAWLLDVDGVLNANKPGWGGPPARRYVHAGGSEYLLRWAPALISRIRLLHASGAVEILWATSWVDHIATIEAALTLPSFPVAFSDVQPGPVDDRKQQVALDLVSMGRRLIWTDDEAFPETWTPRAFLESAGHLLIAPRPNRGLQPDHLDRIEAFASA